MKNFLTLLPLLIMLLAGCEKKEDFPKPNTTGHGNSSLTSTDTSLPLTVADWSFGVGNAGIQGNPNNYQHTLRTSTSNTSPSLPISTTGIAGVTSRTTSYSLGIMATAINDTASLGYWHYRILPSAKLQVGKSLTLKARVRLENVVGNGVSLVLRGDRGTQTALLFRTTEGQFTINGTADFREYSVTMPYSSPVDYVLVYLTMLPQTTGKVIFSDVAVQVN